MITPIPIIIHSGSNTPKEPDHKCPKCGHEWDDISEPTTFVSKVIITIIIAIFLYLLIGLFECFLGGKMYNALFVRTVNNYEVPVGWEIQTNGNGDYIIKTGNHYLTRANFLVLGVEEFSDIYPPLKCSSENRAKSTLKRYLKTKELNTFKNINNL